MAAAEIQGDALFNMKRIGFLGGSFDPIHFGHILLAVQMLESGHLDEVLFCPASCSPFKQNTPPRASGNDRLEMVQLAIAGIRGFSVTSIEVATPGPSYTIDTLHALQRPGVQFHLLLADEAAQGLEQWRKSDELLRLAPPLIGVRDGQQIGGKYASVLQSKTIRMPRMEISSTEIRRRLAEGKYCGHLVPEKALDYIRARHLYSLP
jgi:nicotinate-nucleotide adenylyltransferase